MVTFKANGKEFELPDSGVFNIDECIVMYGYSGLTMDQVSEIKGLHPGVIAGLVHVGIQRANPDLKAEQIEQEVRGLDFAELLGTIRDSDEEDDPPLDLELSGNSESSGTASGNGSETSSAPPEPTGLRAIGTPASATSESDRQTLAG